MLNTLALVAALSLSPAQGGALALTNELLTYGLLGAPRADSKLLPGDAYFIAFDIENISVDTTGVVKYSMTMDVSDSKGKTIFRQEPQEVEALNSLGGTRVPAFAHVEIGLDQPPGEYTLKVIVTDRANKATKTLTRKFEVVAREFGLVRLALTTDGEGRLPAANYGFVGQSIWVNFAAVNFVRDTKKEPFVSVQMTVLDESGKPTLPKPFVGEVRKDVPANVLAVPMQFFLTLNRPGKFTIKIRATDEVGKKFSELTVPLVVFDTAGTKE
jgi:hypothetical protein